MKKKYNTMNEISCYDDMIYMPHHVSAIHPHMALSDRAAQFSPFAALTGHDAAIQETARLTEGRAELDEDVKARLNEKLAMIAEKWKEQPEIRITYFVPDEKKTGGSYVTCVGNLKKIDMYNHTIVMTDRTIIPIEEISEIESSLFGEEI